MGINLSRGDVLISDFTSGIIFEINYNLRGSFRTWRSIKQIIIYFICTSPKLETKAAVHDQAKHVHFCWGQKIVLVSEH